MDAYAVIETGGKQYRVKQDDVFEVEKLNAEVGATVELDTVLAVSDGSELKVGTPVLEGASVSSKVLDHKRGDKVISFKKKRRKGYSRKVGHRQDLTVIQIEAIKHA